MIQRMPRLLDGAMNERERLFPVRADAHMNLTPLSTASLTLPPDAPEVSARDFIELYAPDQSLGIFRATSVRTVYGDQREISLEEAICTLEDDLTGEDTVLNGDMGQVLETLLAFQSIQRWKLGEVESEAQFTDVEAARANVLEAVLQAVATDDTVMLVRDYSSTPWVLRVIKKPEAIACGLRLNRNLNNVTATLDDSALCTRVTAVPSEGEAITLDADTLSAWGVVHRQITITEGKEPAAEAQKYLEAHKNPALSVECDALALAELTGEPWDSFALGQLCAVALPDFGAILRERVVSIYYPDLFSDPRHVRLTLSSQVADASSALASLGAATKSNSDGLGRAFKHIRETENAVYIQAKEIMLRATKTEVAELNGVLTDKISEVSVELDAANAQLRLKANQEYVDQQFSATELLLDGANARIDANALRIDEVNEQISSANLAIDGANARINAEAKRIDEANDLISSANLAIDGANARIDAEAKRIDEANEQISSANLAIDGANARIDAEAKRIDEANGEISSAKLAIDGANAKIEAEAKRASEAEGELTGKLTVASDEIKAEVKRATEKEGEMAASIQANADAIALKVSQETFDELGNRVTKAESSITQHADEISMRVKKGDIASEINQTAQGVLISASKIDLKGYVTAETLAADIAEFKREYAGQFTTSHLFAEDGYFASVNVSGTLTADVIMGGSNVNLAIHYHEFTANADGTIQIGGPSATRGSFKIADTKFYKDGVSAARTAGAKSVSLDHYSTSYAPSFDPKSMTVNAFLTNDEHFSQPVDVTDVYSKGYNDGKAAASGNVTVESISDVTYNADNKNFTITIKLTNGTKVQKIVNGLDAYNAGAASVYVTEDTSHIKWQTTVRKIGSIDGKVTVVLSNGNEYSRSVTSITAPAVRNVNVNTATDKVTVYYANVTSGYTSSDVFDW